MKRFNRIILPFIALVLFAACGTQKDVPYFQNAEYVDLSQSQYLYDAKIMPKDQLTITVSTTNDEAAVPFNMTPVDAGASSTESSVIELDEISDAMYAVSPAGVALAKSRPTGVANEE